MATGNNDITNGCIFQWTIGNLTYQESKPLEDVYSPSFYVDALKGTKWIVIMVLLPEKGVAFYLRRDRKCNGADGIKTDLNCEFAVLEKDGSIFKQVTRRGNIPCKDAVHSHGYIEFCDHSQDFITERVFSKGRLKIQCTLWIKNEKPVNPQHIHAQTISLNGTFKHELQATRSISSKQVASGKRCQLSNDLKWMFEEEIFSDVKLQTSTKTFPAHKNILSARSPVFRIMFYRDMKEKNSGIIKITDLDEDTVHQMLLYIYTDALDDLPFQNACKLYEASDKYEILSLRSICSSILIANLSPTNVTDILCLADQHQDDKLKSDVQDFILNHDETVFCSQEWRDFMDTNCKLAADMMYWFTVRKVGSKRFVSGNRFSPY